MEITAATGQAQTASQSASTQLSSDLDNFLVLLTAQITNQDPLKPMDSTTFVSQLAQLTQVEQTIKTNTSLEDIGQKISGFTELSDVQLIGRDVLIPTDNLDLNYGQATIQYDLAEKASNVSINIIDQNGVVVKEITNLPNFTGTKHTVNWDGLGTGDVQLADGAYKFEVMALKADGTRAAYNSFATTYVEELNFVNGQPKLVLRNNDEVASSEILAVK